jgi:hypothetical protein
VFCRKEHGCKKKVAIVWFYCSWIALMFILFLLLVTDRTASYMHVVFLSYYFFC